jgi:hypothetical protein
MISAMMAIAPYTIMSFNESAKLKSLGGGDGGEENDGIICARGES